ncbi:hypothetical protein F383_22568 [Gossypium arboreum]|uniref:Uncharacterized protein n=1 Tax=Gossypium arboreum TaxID=29729 RepID=A0A0B0MQR6_GOSAR|nr:hypothetical protein F383_22568 [Gossypium arboreum]
MLCMICEFWNNIEYCTIGWFMFMLNDEHVMTMCE